VAVQVPPVEPFDLVVFGGTGDLAFRKLLPALYLRYRDGVIPSGARIIAAARQAMNDDTYRAVVAKVLSEHVPAAKREKDAITRFLGLLSFVSLDALSTNGWQDLAWVLGSGNNHVRVFYLAVAPSLIAAICQRIGSEGLVTSSTRIVVEKPVGHDLKSAIAISDAVGAVFGEGQIFRIDHYLGKGMVQNLMTLRFANALFEPLWNAARIDHVEITVAETIGVEERGAYYDATGALRDVVQNHVLQLLCLIAMEPPSSIDPEAIRDEKLKVLKSLKPLEGTDSVAALTARGQYGAGKDVPSYAEEIGHATRTETFAAIKAEIGNWRWAGAPFYLRAGKRMAGRVSEIVIAFRPIPYSIFLPASGAVHPNRLVLRVQPDEGVKLWLMARDPGPAMHLTCIPLQVSLATAFNEEIPDAYERLLMDVVRGDQTLFMRRDVVEAAWRWIDPIVAAWQDLPEPPQVYAPGSWGPEGAEALAAREGRKWHEPMPV
jgi:glucose-6-phosphate 1-dehydrogenase